MNTTLRSRNRCRVAVSLTQLSILPEGRSRSGALLVHPSLCLHFCTRQGEAVVVGGADSTEAEWSLPALSLGY
jgi:hypothetical protein